jgi:hypothetical protein
MIHVIAKTIGLPFKCHGLQKQTRSSSIIPAERPCDSLVSSVDDDLLKIIRGDPKRDSREG